MNMEFVTKLFMTFSQEGPGLALFDPKLNLVRANTPFCQMLGYSTPELTGINRNHVISPPYREEDYGLLQRLHMGQSHSEKGEKPFLHRDGKTVWVNEVICSLSAETDFKTRHFLSLVEDITQQRQLVTNHQLAFDITQNMTDGMIVTDSRFRIFQSNPAATRITGYQSHELLGHPPRFLQSGNQDTTFFRNMWLRLKRSGEWQGEIWHRHKSGELHPLWLRINSLYDETNKVSQYIGIFSEISSQIKLREDLNYLAHHDVLTGLPNRMLFYDRMKMAMRYADRCGRGVALLFIDLDNFKQVNDSFGHTAGDRLLAEVAVRLKAAVREEDTVARFGGDEFMVLAAGIDKPHDAASIARNILSVFRKPITTIQQQELTITISLGIGFYPQDGNDVEELIMKADAAMYGIKGEGGNSYRFFHSL